MEEQAYTDLPSSRELIALAYFLEGIYLGKGNIQPLGKIHLENLWKTIKKLQSEGL